MLLLTISIIVVIVLFKVNRLKLTQGYKIINPISTILVIWVAVYIFHSIYFHDSLSTDFTYFLTLLGLLSVALGFWCAYSRDTNYRACNRTYNMFFLKKLLYAFVIVDVIRLAYDTNLIVFNLAGGSWYMLLEEGTVLRNLYLDYKPALYEDLFTFLSNLLCYIGYVILGVYVASSQKDRWKYFLIISIIELAISIITMSKLSFTLYLVAFSVAYLNNQSSVAEQKKKIKAIVPFVLTIIIVFFFFIGFQRNYAETKGGLSTGVINGLVNYFAGPLEAFSIYLEKGPSILDVNRGYIDIGNTQTNVYTWYFYFINGISYAGIAVYSFLLGLLSGKIYKPMRHNLFYDVCNSWICVFFAFSFFDFLLKFTVYQVLFIAVWVIDKKYKKKLYI